MCCVFVFLFFFFKQKTAYEIGVRLVGSEMCIRDRFVDIAGLVKGASQGAGLGNKFLGHIRECDAIVHVVRCFDDDNIIHVAVSYTHLTLPTKRIV